MLWCGPSKKLLFKNELLRKVYRRQNLKSQKRVWYHWTYGQAYRRHISLHVPSLWDFILFRKESRYTKMVYRLLLLYSPLYYFMFPAPIHWRTWYQNRFNNMIDFIARQSSHYTITYWTRFTKIFNSFHRPFFFKLKFRGKGYYMYRNHRNTITPQLGHAHKILTYVPYLSVKFFKKGALRRSILLLGLFQDHLYLAAKVIRNMRSYNIFTGRGVRFARDSIYRKPGKISTYR